MTKTIAELLFEQFCAEHALRCEPVSRALQRTPDYDVYFGTQRAVVELKQVDPNPDDAVQLAKMEAGGVATFGGEAGKRVRQEITDAKKQLRSRAKGKFPALLVLYNNAQPIHYLDPMFILLGMYGELTARLAIPSQGGRPFVESLRFGGKRMVTEKHNTTISAVCVLIEDEQERPTLTFYHNHFAAMPFEPDWFRAERSKHYQLPKAESREFGFWAAI